jgi:hypothetical protein
MGGAAACGGRFARVVADEQREDYDVSTNELAFDPSGKVVSRHGEWRLDPKGYRTFLAATAAKVDGYEPASVHRFTASVPADMRADIINRLLADGSDEPIKLRTRLGAERERVVYACTSQSYAAFNQDMVARELPHALEKNVDTSARADVKYDGSVSTARVVWHNTHDITESGCGDVFRFGIEVRTADDKSSALWIRLIAYINRCLNYLVIGQTHVNIGRRVHAGKVRAMRSWFRARLREARSKGAVVIDAWTEASRDRLIEDANKAEPEKVFGKLIRAGYGKVAGEPVEALVKRYYTAWQRDPGYSRLHFVNALTRAAHEATWASPWVQRDVEQSAAQLVFVHRVAGF